ncbi:MAG: sigma-70 family RNA polymerase sigma factor [Isosphaeraceae bacterium]|nr:sigma-70 family RNA polymerase sigma factor [Isosphaeraceae bacterium]
MVTLGTGKSWADVGPILEGGTFNGLSDGEVLSRFLAGRDERAFEAMVVRLGPMVLGTCRRMLRDRQDAEDAFQATFLVLALRAGTLREREKVGPWLHGVTVRVARRVRAQAARKGRLVSIDDLALTADGSDHEDALALRDMLDTELERLPERYRRVVRLCCFEGRTQAEAAEVLNWSAEMVRGRLERARVMLRDRLRRRGVAPAVSVTAVSTGLNQAARAAVPDGLVKAAVQLVFQADGRGAAVVALARGVIPTMRLLSFGKVPALLIAAGLTLSIAGALGGQLGAIEPPEVLRKSRVSPDGGVAQDSREAIRKAIAGGTLQIRGSLEASASESVTNSLPGVRALRSILPEGTKVKKGDVVAELDSATFREEQSKLKQVIAERKAEFDQAVMDMRLAELSEKEAVEQWRLDAEAVNGELFLEQSAQERAEANRERSEATRKIIEQIKEDPTPQSLLNRLALQDRLDSVEEAILRHRHNLERLHEKRRHLEEYRKPRVTKFHENEVEKAKHRVFRAEVALDVAKSEESKLDDMIRKCELRANIDGIVVHANDPNRFTKGVPGSNPQIVPGALVRERQVIFRVDDPSKPLRVMVKVPERIVDRVRVGEKVKVTVDAFADGKVLEGTVQTVMPLPDPSTRFDQESKVYTTIILLNQAETGLRPGMTVSAAVPLRTLEEEAAKQK